MATLKSYTENREMLWKVTVGRKTFKGFKTAVDALRGGVSQAQQLDGRAAELCAGRTFESQVGIVFGADVRNKFINNNEGKDNESN